MQRITWRRIRVTVWHLHIRIGHARLQTFGPLPYSHHEVLAHSHHSADRALIARKPARPIGTSLARVSYYAYDCMRGVHHNMIYEKTG